ncbi:MAG: Asp23/Gls24 family envelope stress response protein [Lachnospiraceae bacterium]|nr:Asp23/Gls24 family envelope stress response protein [Lachnospiraceae bacterium]
MSKTENKNVHMIHADAQLGEVQIADEVVAIIAGLAATEVEGVASMAGNVTNELVAKLGMKKLSKGVKVLVSDQNVDVDLALNIDYGYSIMKVSEKVQDKVKAAIENMTGLHVSIVNIRIASVNMEKNK